MKIQILVSLIIGTVFIWLAVRGVDFTVLKASLLDMELVYLLPFTALVLLYQVLRVYRWQLILGKAHPVPYRTLFSANQIGFMVINILPARLGELGRPYLLLERANVPLGAGIASVVVERMLDFLCMLFILLAVVVGVDLPTKVISLGGQQYDILGVVERVFLLAALPAIGGVIGLLLFEPLMYKLLHLTFGKVLPRFSAHFETFVRTFMERLRPLQNPRTLALQLGLTLLIWSCTPLTEWLLFKSFHLHHLGLDAALTVVAALLIGMLIPAPPGFAGNFEISIMGGLAVFGVTGGVALAYAIMLHFLQLFFVAVLGLYFLWRDRVSFRSIVAFSRSMRGKSMIEASETGPTQP